MIRLVCKYLTWGHAGSSFGPFIFLRDKKGLENYSLINHETIHFYQQLELLFVGQWLLYLFFYLRQRLKGDSHYSAYRSNPFEKEAYANEKNLTYIFQRKPYAWMRQM